MKSVLVSAAIVSLTLVASASAQSVSGLGFATIGPGSVSDGGGTTLHLSGGGEVLYKGAVGALAEVGYLGPTTGFTDEGFGLFSLNGIYHFRVPGKSAGVVSPFATGGYSVSFRESSKNLWNFGGGVDWWFSRKVGVRVEVRDQLWHEDFTSPYYSGSHTYHVWNFRTGVVFRRQRPPSVPATKPDS